MSGLIARYEQIVETPGIPLLAVVFGGRYAPGSEGNEFAREMVRYLRATLNEVQPAGVLFDLTMLDYVWGDAIGELAIPLMGKGRNGPPHFLPSAVVATGQTAHALKPLLQPKFILGIAGVRLFGTRKKAVRYLEKTIGRGRRMAARKERKAKWRYAMWPVVDATLRSSAWQSEGLDAGPAAALHQFLPLEVIWAPVELVGVHRVRFLYTYSAGGRYYVGYANRFVWSASDTAKLFGKAPGETIRVRYNPKKPEVSIVLAEDNPE
jgi:hypothetical protein